ncbi:hypothetical protein ABZ318_02410 [Streptomyces sp. NPDC006197]|uniref:hypothetical protein n=1 Tax=Streptomyces sp. NPDC006197 TaxID=3156685 RepID=UPI0033A63857
MVSRSWFPNGEESGTRRPSYAAERTGGRAGDADFALSAAGLFEAVLGLALAHPHLSTEGK